MSGTLGKVVIAILLLAATSACAVDGASAGAGGSAANSNATNPDVTEGAGLPNIAMLELDGGLMVATQIPGTGPTDVSTRAEFGRIVAVDDRCWGLHQNGEVRVLILPPGTQLNEEGSGVVTPDGVRLQMGDNIEGAGYGTAYATGKPDSTGRCSAGVLAVGLIGTTVT